MPEVGPIQTVYERNTAFILMWMEINMRTAPFNDVWINGQSVIVIRISIATHEEFCPVGEISTTLGSHLFAES